MRGYVEGDGPEDYSINIESGFRVESGDFPTVSVNPFFPTLRSAESLAEPGGGMAMTVARLARTPERLVALYEVGAQIRNSISLIADVQRLMEYYNQKNYRATANFLREKAEIDVSPNPRAPAFHSAVFGVWLGWMSTCARGARDPEAAPDALRTVSSWHRQGINSGTYAQAITEMAAGETGAALVRGLVGATGTLMASAPAWSAGYMRNAGDADQSVWDSLTLFQDEFNTLRDTYQRVYEACCGSLWPIIMMRNVAENGNVDDFTGVEYRKRNDPKVYRVKSMRQFKALPNAFKLEIVKSFPGLKQSFDLLDSKLRNDIGHASAHHDLTTGQIHNEDGLAMSYFDLVGRTASLFGPLLVCVGSCGLIFTQDGIES
jgi:hypothetical protein